MVDLRSGKQRRIKMKVSRGLKRFIVAAVAVLAGAFGASADVISADFNAYTAPDTLVEGVNVGTAVGEIVSVLDSGDNSAFKIYGRAGGSNSAYSAKIVGDNTGSNYLELNTVKGINGFDLISQISSAAPVSLSTNYGVKAVFSVNKQGALGQGSQYFGLYASGAMGATTGGYDYRRLVAANTNSAAAALGFSISNTGNGTLVRTGTSNIHEFWNGTTWQTASTNFVSGLDITGETQYEITLLNDGADMMSITLVDLTTTNTIIDLDSSLSALGSNITGGAGTMRFSGGDIGNNSTENWITNIYSIEQIPEPATVGLMGLAAAVIFAFRKWRSL
jgi:hypothetical protein